ncbi:MAG: TVP38/TMEM64 family protein, partial [Pseudomonadota bacterium]
MTGPKETEQEIEETVKPSVSGKFRKWLPLVVLLALMTLAFSQGLHKQLTLSNLIMQRQDLIGFVDQNLLAALAVFCLAYILCVALSFPGASLLKIAGAMLTSQNGKTG